MNKEKRGLDLHLLFRLLGLPSFVILMSLIMHSVVLAQTAAPSPWVLNGTNITNTNSGNVGIGTANPVQLLQINATATGRGALFSNTATAAGTNTVLQFKFDVGPTAEIRAVKPNAGSGFGSAINTDLSFRVWDLGTAGNWSEALYIKSTGNVGIGTTNPQARLDVAGNINVSGNINAKYQDVAEWVPSSQKLSAGTVVILDPDRSNQVIASSEPYDTRVAGVISAQPGVLLGEDGEGKVKVATMGRVKVRVDASRGPIRIGDLLVTGVREGIAMKSEPIVVQGRKFHAPGTIIGKALEALESGVGEIQVLLSLQ